MNDAAYLGAFPWRFRDHLCNIGASPSAECVSISCFDYQGSPSAESGPVVLILTPIKDTNLRRQQRYEKNILSITYPKSMVNIGFLVSDNQRDDSPALVRKTVERLSRDGNFRSVRANHRIFLDALSKDSLKLETEQSRHSRYIQKSRRARMARARNYLLALELSRECDFVLWLDNDLFSYPKDIIQVMIRATATGKKIVAAPCMESERPGKVYDLNSWRRKQIPPTPSAKPLFAAAIQMTYTLQDTSTMPLMASG